jgi:hypothetical protein
MRRREFIALVGGTPATVLRHVSRSVNYVIAFL